MKSIRVWRICHRRYADTSFTGEGAKKYGGRFNSQGKPAVYTSDTLSLAILEMLVQVNDRSYLTSCVFSYADLSVSMIETLTAGQLPEDWNALPYRKDSQKTGDKWLESRRSAVLKVPSVVVPIEWNYILNPDHPDFGHIKIAQPEELPVDERLFEY